MGRSKTTFKRIPNDRVRKATFMQRRKGLMKKISEFSTMCGVEACLIVYDENGDARPMTFPQQPTKVQSIINKYEREKNEKPCKIFDLEDFFKNKMNMVEAEISKVQKETLKIQNPTSHPSFNILEEEQLNEFIAVLDAKLGACNERIEILKKEHRTEANNLNCIQSMAPETSGASQLNFMHNVSGSQLIPAPMNALNDYNGNMVSMLGAKNEACNQRIGMLQNQTQSQFIPTPMNALIDNNGNIIYMLDDGAGSQTIEMSQNDNQSEANFSFIQNMIQESIVSDQSQLNFMPYNFQNQLIPFPMNELNNYNGTMNFTNQVQVPLHSTNQLCRHMDCAGQLDELHHLTGSQNSANEISELLNWTGEPDESVLLNNPLPPPMYEFQNNAWLSYHMNP
ncbi:agamous-like MADS-box protein AGL82 [Gastrolobium bilobum]|uniref:agamous-like MADS-box protein AGL82 n=1 Tax=Gastrolobium bilobum TaxID=150636 RepID=UPI002AB182F3|nr:agamous-like MADS-box protein AGL82 [Gastrolobium bilobum]